MEVKVFVFRELFKEQHQKGINIFAGGYCIGDAIVTIAVSDVDGLVKKDNGGVVVP